MTDAAIGCYTFAAAATIAASAGFEETIAAGAAYYALLLGIAATVGAAVTGFADYFTIPSGTQLKRSATYHWIVMVTATVFFVAAAWCLHGTYEAGEVDTLALVLDLVGYGLLSVGGWIGGSLVFKHGMRVEPQPPGDDRA